jgi:calcium/calmodulin-dependent protein kinase I
VKLIDIFESPRKVYLVLELLTGGELFDRIVTVYPNGFSERDASILINKIVSAVDYLHSKGIVHRDLKPENLLYVSQSKDSDIKLTDFGLAKIMTSDALLKTACGTPNYVAPELLLNKGYTEAVDMWSVGVMLYILLCGFPPFFAEDNATLFEQIIQGNYTFMEPYWNHISASAKDLVSRLLQTDPKRRLTAKQVMSHPWVRGTTAQSKILPSMERLSKSRARRRFRVAINAVIASIRLKRALGSISAVTKSTKALNLGASPRTRTSTGSSSARGTPTTTSSSAAYSSTSPPSSRSRGASSATSSASTSPRIPEPKRTSLTSK